MTIDRVQLNDTIAASATPPGTSGVALIRLSGPASKAVAAAIFRPQSARFPAADAMAGYTCAPGWIVDPLASDQAPVDQVVLTHFAAPHSFTGEDVYEITCHGGTAVRQAILELLYSLGVQPAGPGEFTRRAFLNGKLDLAQAEAVMDLIASTAGKRARAAARQLQGHLSREIQSVREDLYALLAQLELVLEYPEHEESSHSQAGLVARLSDAIAHVATLAASFRQGRLLSEGFTVVIVGRPNAGKSSLLNALAGYDRAIVTPVAGTTRDTVEQLVDIGGIPVRLIDTAGLRDTSDLVERIGVDRARSAILEADLVLWLISPPDDWSSPEVWSSPEIWTGNFPRQDMTQLDMSKLDTSFLDAELDELRDLAEKTDALLLIGGKEDLVTSTLLREWLAAELPDLPLVSFSAKTFEGLPAIRQAIVDRYDHAGNAQADEALVTSSRHKACLDKTLYSLEAAALELTRGELLDVVAALVRSALENLAEITGELVSDTLIETIFSRFCVGK